MPARPEWLHEIRYDRLIVARENKRVRLITPSGVSLHLERFRAKWTPVRVKKTRQNKNPELRFWFNQNRKCSLGERADHAMGFILIMAPIMVVAVVPTFADVPAADGNAVVKPTAALAADGNAVVESTATLEATTVPLQATAAAMHATAAAIEATAAAIEAAAMEASAAVKAAASATATASGMCSAAQNHRATQHGSTCGEFPHKVHGCRNSTPCHA
jgi:hypothetical protein